MKIGIIGMGWVGSSVAISTLHEGIARELLVHDIKPEIAEGEAMDLAHGSSFYPRTDIRVAAVEDMLDADAVVISAGVGGGPNTSRLSLLTANAVIARDLGAKLRRFQGLVIVVTNPVDIMTQLIAETSGLPPARVLAHTLQWQDIPADAQAAAIAQFGVEGFVEIVVLSGFYQMFAAINQGFAVARAGPGREK